MSGVRPGSLIGGGLGMALVWLAAAIWELRVLGAAPYYELPADRGWMATELSLAAVGLTMVALGLLWRVWREGNLHAPGHSPTLPPS